MSHEQKIILYAPSIHTGGGTERVLVNLANELNAKGFNIIIVVNLIGDRQLYMPNKGVDIKQFWFEKSKKKHPKSIIHKIINRLFYSWILNQFLKTVIKNDNVLIIGFSTGLALNCFDTKFANKVIAFEHWPYWINSKNPKQEKRIKSVYPRLKLIIVLTNHEKKVYEALGCKNVIVIPNAYSFLPDKPAKLDNKTVLSIGHFNEQKRRDLLVKSWKYVNEKHPDWELVIVGDGPQMQDTISQIDQLGLSNSIRIENPTPNIQEYYQDASIYVLSSEYEAFALVLLEARAYGIPCVSFDIIAGPNEVMNSQKDGFLVDFPDTKALGAKVNLLIENEALRQDIGSAARQDVISRFSPQKIYNIWEKLLLSFN